MEDNDLFILYSQYHPCWCPGCARSQDISSHGVDMAVPEYSILQWQKDWEGFFRHPELTQFTYPRIRVPTVWKGQNSGPFPGFFQANIHYSRVNLTHSDNEKNGWYFADSILNTFFTQMSIYWFNCQSNVLLCVQSTVHQQLFSQIYSLHTCF